MRKRLRKKKHVGEFQEFGAELEVMMHTGTDSDQFVDDFLVHAVESNGLQFGGGGGGLELRGFVELGRRDVCAANLAKVTAWLAAEPRVESFTIGRPVDAWAET